MKKSTKSIIAAAVILAFPAAGIACDANGAKSASCPAYHAKKGHHAIPGKSPNYIRKILRNADRLGLSDKQRQQIGKLLVEAESDAARAHAEAEVTVAAFKSRLHSGSVSDKEVNAYTKRMGELRAARLAANLKASVATSRLLTEEQQSKLYAGKSWKGDKK